MSKNQKAGVATNRATNRSTNLVTPSEYSRMAGVDKSVISRQISRGLIPSHRGMVDPAEADRARQSGLNPIRGGRKISGKTEVGAARGQAVAVAALDDTSRAEAERKLSVAKAARAELALQIEQGKYVELAAFKRECERMVVAAKTRLRAIPNSLAPELAVITNTAVIFTRLQESIDEALSELASAEYLDKES